MQPENNAQNNAGAEIDAALKTAEASPQENVMAAGTADDKKNDEKSKMSKKQIIGLVVLSLIAIGGVLFGVYGMNSQNEQIAQLTVRATDAEGKVAQLETEKVTITDPDGGMTEITDSVSTRQNPVIKSNNSKIRYGLSIKSSNVFTSGSNEGKYIMIDVSENGDITCTKWLVGGYSDGKCSIGGINGDVYKIVEFGAGQTNIDNCIGFIMTDGTVKYFPLYSSVENDDFTIKGDLKIDGYVTDAFDITVSPTNSSVGGSVSTIFIMNNGSYVQYDKSML